MESDHHHQSAMMSVLLLMFLGFFLSSSQAYTFYVGGKDGWVLKPREDYIQWASRNRFLINDTLIFKYKKGHDTVLEVDNDGFFTCNKEKPLQTLKDGVSEFKFNRAGPFYFISGHADNCAKGQRIIIVVLHPRSPPPAPVPAAPPVAADPPSDPSPTPSPAPAAPGGDIVSPAPAPEKSSSAITTIFDGPVLGFVSIFVAMATIGFMI